MYERNNSRITPAIIVGSLIIGASIVLGLWLAWPRYAPAAGANGDPMVVDTRTGTMFGNYGTAQGGPTKYPLDGPVVFPE